MKNKKILLNLLIAFVMVFSLAIGFGMTSSFQTFHADYAVTFVDIDEDAGNVSINIDEDDTFAEIAEKLIAQADWESGTSVTYLYFDNVAYGLPDNNAMVYGDLGNISSFGYMIEAPEHIDFTPTAQYAGNYTQDSLNDTLLLNGDEQNVQVTVNYRVVYNDGVNSLVLIPTYNKDVFTIVSNGITVNENALGAATITGTDVEADVIKIVLESNVPYLGIDGNNTVLMSIVFDVDVQEAEDADYEFGLELADAQNYNDTSKANVFLTGEHLGEQKEVAIHIVAENDENVVRILKKQDATIEIGYNYEDNYQDDYSYRFTYNHHFVSVSKVDELTNIDDYWTVYDLDKTIEFTYNGTAEPVIRWYKWVDSELQLLNTTDNSAPNYESIVCGSYVLGISAPADGLYRAVAEEYRDVLISRATVTFVVDNQQSAYSNAIVELTYQVNGLIYDQINETPVVRIANLATTATNQSPVGTYPITSSYVIDEGYEYFYNVSVEPGTYTIVAKSITIHLQNQTAEYTGLEPEVDQTKYEEYGTLVGTTVEITKAQGVNVGEYLLSATATNPNYTFSYEQAIFTITSVGKNADYIKQFFEGRTVEYNAQEQDLLVVKNVVGEEQRPNWLTYSSGNRTQTNANQYVVNITVTLNQQDADNWTGGQTEFIFSVNSEITKADLTITADDKSKQYGVTPSATLTPAQVTTELGDNIAVSFTVKNGNETITLSNATPVDEYAIVPSATNGNYNITFVNGTYTITKATPVVTVVANDVEYNTALNYTVTVTVNEITITEYTVTVKQGDNAVEAPYAVGTYNIVATVAGTNNYYAAEGSDEFNVVAAKLATPTGFQYNKATATWTAVTKTVGGNDLKNGTAVSYVIHLANAEGQNVSALTWTAGQTGDYLIKAVADNANYLASEDAELGHVGLVTYVDGSHPNNPATPAGMPESELLFNGQLATEPQDPTLAGYEFGYWHLEGENAFDFENDAMNGSLTLYAYWDAETFTLTFKFAEDDNVNVFEIEVGYNATNIVFETSAMPTKASEVGFGYVYNNKAVANNVEYVAVYNNGYITISDYTVLGNATFIAQYDISYNTFTLTYYVSYDGAEYVQYQSPVNVSFGEEIEYKVLSTDLVWYKADAWYANQDRTVVAPVTMPSNGLSVYGAIVFNIGQGDVNGDGMLDTDDIALYRQWIVGGYTMTNLANGNEWETANSEDFDIETRYFLNRVADNNADQSRDIRDISIIRMAIVGGYTWDNENGYNVTGSEIIKNAKVSSLSEISEAIAAGKKVTLKQDLTDAEGAIDITTGKNVYINLGGKTLTLKSFRIASTSYSTITVVNGTIVTTEGITISAPYGNVVLTNLTGYDADGEVNLAAASHSLHFSGKVEFRHGNKQESAPAIVNVENGTHVVVEEEANFIAEKIVVTENFVASQAQDAVITLDNYSVVTDEIVVVGNVIDNSKITTIEQFREAAAMGGKYTLDADFSYTSTKSFDSRIYFSKDTIINLNGHTVTSTNEIPFAVINHATLTINGNGYVNGVEGCVMAFGGSSFVINGGTYTCTDNFVFGTNGNLGNGDNNITINAGTFYGQIATAGYIACGIYVANDDVVAVNGGTFNITNGVGMAIRAGKVTVANEVVFNCTKSERTQGWVGDRKTGLPAGEAFVLDLAANYPGYNNEFSFTNNTAYEAVTITRTINNLADLLAFRDAVNAGNNFAGETVLLNADITLNSAWEPISNYSRKDSASEANWFAGTFNGNGHTISGLTNVGLNANAINSNSDWTYGLFGSVKNAVIKNLTLANVNIAKIGDLGGDSLGALVGYYYGNESKTNISNIAVSGTIVGADNVGGAVGRATGTHFKALNVTVSGTVTADYKASGIVGTGNAHEMVFENCTNNANVSSITVRADNAGYNAVAGISITWKDACQKVVMTGCANNGTISTENANAIAGALCADYSPQTQLNANGTWIYESNHWTQE